MTRSWSVVWAVSIDGGWTKGLVVCLLCLTVALPHPTQAADLKLTTWNLNWLTTRPAGSPGLPPDLKTRAPDDFQRLRTYALELDADIVAVQEVDTYDAFRLVFPPERYVLHLTRDRVTQKVGIAIRRGLRHDIHPDVQLSSDPASPVRAGLDVTLTASNLRLLVVHLKQGCREPRQDRSGGRDCVIFHGQTDPLLAWIAARQQAGTPFAILGDFNRWMDRRDPFLDAIRRTAPIARATEGYANPCWRDASFIDHILVGGAAVSWLIPNSLIVFRYRESGDDWKARISDHCPVSARIRVPDGPATDTRGDPQSTAPPTPASPAPTPQPGLPTVVRPTR